MDCIVIGGGVAGLQAAMTFRQRWPDKSVVLVDAENEIGYFRTLLPQFMVKTLAERKLFFRRPEDDPGLTIQCGVKVESIDRRNRQLHLSDGKKLAYAHLIIASGGKPVLPPVCPRGTCGGIFPVRSLTVARAIRSWLPEHPPVAILGGGLVGVKTAVHLAHAGIPVTLIEREDRLLPQALTREAAAVIAGHVARHGIDLYLESSVDDIQLKSGTLAGIRVDGKWISCRTLLIAAGSTPDIEFLADSGLLQDGRLPVTPALQTLDERIFAAGDAVTISRGNMYTPWTWPQAVTQGKLAALNLYRTVPLPLFSLTRVNCMNLHGLSLVVLGVPVAGADVHAYARPDAGVYRELFLVDGKIVGGALIGDIRDAGRLHAMMNAGRTCDTEGDDLLKPRGRTIAVGSHSALGQQRRAIWLAAGGT